MSAKMLMHPNSLFLHYSFAPIVEDYNFEELRLRQKRTRIKENYVNHELEFVGSMAGRRVS